MGIEEYEAALEAARWTECANCLNPTLRAGEWPAPDDGDYCGEFCARAGARTNSVLMKPQPAGCVIENWSV